MRHLFIIFVIFLLSACSLDPNAASQLTKGEPAPAKVSMLSSVNNQLTAAHNKSAGQSAFYSCLATNQFKNSNTLTTFLYSTNRDVNKPLTVTIDSAVLSAYASQIWQRVDHDQRKMLNILSLHRSQDRTCFQQKFTALGQAQTADVEDYQNSAKLLLQVYDYIKMTLQRTDYAEFSEQIAREHIPIRVLLPTT